MNWEVFTKFSTLQVQIHWVAAVLSLALGLLVFLRKKGTRIHRITGRMFVVALLVTSVSAFFVRGYGNREPWSLFNGFSLIHLLVPYTIFMLARALIAIRRGDVNAHKWGMIWTFTGGIIIAGAFTFLPGRHMHTLFFGDPVGLQQDIQSDRKRWIFFPSRRRYNFNASLLASRRTGNRYKPAGPRPSADYTVTGST